MHISEAIHQADENAQMYKDKAQIAQKNNINGNYTPMVQYYEKLANEQLQLKEWLKELQILRWKNKIDSE